ncbi:RT0821/Lpp0805 family surface protein [Nitratireductor arenosus]|uniref:RT0821/Lpp0805 family surface protein n=1 Tax=Nitratireductor arenosus TaxID=2682096 RepID=UPI0018D243CD|nr:RT0821/Lpp0805 family surface protein [Nitratireductor arenosus]
MRQRIGCASGVKLVLLPLVVALGGCVSSGFGLGDDGPDRTIVTSAVAPSPAAAVDTETRSDEATIRNAVTSANLETLAGGALSWANAETGSRGEVATIVEFERDGVRCRRFRVSRESFQGVALFTGETCLTPGAGWWTRAFEPV